MRINTLRFLVVFSISILGLGATPAFPGNDHAFAKFIFGAATILALSQSSSRNHYIEYSISSRKKFPKKTSTWIVEDLLPAKCNRLIHTKLGAMRIAPNQCLDNNYSYAMDLPVRCQHAVKKWNGNILRGYKVRCLQKHGYSFQW